MSRVDVSVRTKSRKRGKLQKRKGEKGEGECFTTEEEEGGPRGEEREEGGGRKAGVYRWKPNRIRRR